MARFYFNGSEVKAEAARRLFMVAADVNGLCRADVSAYWASCGASEESREVIADVTGGALEIVAEE